MAFNRAKPSKIFVLFSTITLLTIVSSMSFFNVKFSELNNARLIATSKYNYAISSPKLTEKNWRSVSVNGNNVMIVTTGGDVIKTTKDQFGATNVSYIEMLRDEIDSSSYGYTQISSSSGQNIMTSSNTGTGGGSNGISTSYSSSASGFMSSSSGGLKANDLSVNMKDEFNFSVSKSNLPFNWARVFYNGDMITTVARDGDVEMRPIGSMDSSQVESINKLKSEVQEFQKRQIQQFSNTMQSSMDMVSNVFNSIMNRFPKPPSYGSSGVTDMFGDNFPFGPNNSPFSAAAGWPFAGGSFAYAT